LNWKQEYREKCVSAEEAVRVVKSGDRVAFSLNENPVALSEALTARLPDLEDVKMLLSNPLIDYGWFEIPAGESKGADHHCPSRLPQHA
jgi:acyl-CoA hydrolase